MKFSFTGNIAAFVAEQDNVAKQIGFATVVALNRTSNEIRFQIVEKMKRVFDRPTPRTLDSLQTIPATKANPEALVTTKTRSSSVPPGRFLSPQVEGGQRRMKSTEKKLLGYTSPGEFAVLDRFGNIPGGTYVKILSQLRLQFDETSNANDSKRSKRKRTREAFFRRGKVIFLRRREIIPAHTFASGKAVKASREDEVRPYLIVTSPPTYRKRLPFFEIGQKVFDDLMPVEFERALVKALIPRTAK